MIRKIFTLALTALMLNLFCAAPVAAGAQKQSKEERRAAKVKSQIALAGTGTEARVAVKLRDKSELKGYVSEMGTEQFALTDEKTGATTDIMFAQVEKVKLRPRLRTALKENFTVKKMAKGFILGAAGFLMFVVAVCALSSECQGS
ncbi:MAG TPA: hypothetical protein VF527_16175 [Pyrinomonadaceae bacterium]|jgi:type III secretory pathway component EscR